MDAEIPRVFIGSSTEGATLARAIQAGLSNCAECTVWDQGAFELGRSTLDSLYTYMAKFDFAVFLVTPDDQVETRGKSHTSARDNVIFEIGLFIGGLGIDRVIFVSAGKLPDFRLPSDLAGITHAHYDHKRVDGNVYAAVGPACLSIERHIQAKSNSVRRQSSTEMVFAGAICFRIADRGVEYLLVGSSNKRRIFPKGDIKPFEKDPKETAIRIAKKEAGARGLILGDIYKNVNYFNDERSVVHQIRVYLLNVSTTLEVGHDFRSPEWHDLSEAITALTKDRDYNTSFELARAMEWADREISSFRDDVKVKKKKKKEKGQRVGR